MILPFARQLRVNLIILRVVSRIWRRPVLRLSLLAHHASVNTIPSHCAIIRTEYTPRTHLSHSPRVQSSAARHYRRRSIALVLRKRPAFRGSCCGRGIEFVCVGVSRLVCLEEEGGGAAEAGDEEGCSEALGEGRKNSGGHCEGISSACMAWCWSVLGCN